MSKRTQDMAKLRRKLEQSSRKTRRSTDLRRSLGRKSVGDNCDTASFEQASFSNSTLNESCHLNTDSAIIDPGIAENPEWFKVVPADIQAREESILAARQKERDAEESNESNLSHFNISIDQHKIHNVFDCSVLVSRESIDRHINRNPINVDESIGSSAVENLSTELPKRRLNTLRRGLKKRSGKAFYTELRKALEDSEEEGDEPQRENRKSNLKKVQENLTADRHSETSNIESPFDDEGELPKRKPNSLRRGPRKRTEKSLEKELGEALEDSELSDESAEPPSKRAKSNSKKIEIKSATMKSQPSNPVSFNGNDSSFEVPKRKPNTLRRELREKSRKSFENALKLALENSGVSDESMQSSKGNPENNSKEMPEDVITTIQTRASKLVSFHGNDSSIELPKRKHNTLGKELRSKSRKSFEVALRKALEESGHSDESMDVSKENPQNTSKEMPENVPTSTQSQPSNPLSIHGNDSSLEIPKRRPNTLRRGMKERSRKSFEDALKFALEDSGQSNDTITSPHHSQTSELGDKENVPNIKITKPLKDSEDDIGSKSLSMPLGAEACNMDGLSDVIAPNKKSLSLGKKRISKECDFSVVVEVSEPEPSQDNGLSDVIAPNRKSLSLGKKRISKECDFSVVVEVSEPEPSQDKAPQLQGNLNLNFVESRITENCIQSPEDSVTDTTRHVPISIANAELIQHAQTPLDSINRSKNLSVRSGKSVQPAPEVTLSFLELPERNRLQESVLSEIMPVNVGVSMESGMQLDKSGTVLSQQSFQAVNASPLSTQESLHPRRISNSFQDKPVDENLEKQSRKTVKNSDIYDEESCHSSASTFSLASDTIISDSVFQKPLSNLGKKSDFETATTASQVIETTESDSVFKRTSSNAEKHSHLETSTNFSQIIESVGSDSVFTRTSGNSRKMKSLENQTEHFSTNKSITSCVPDASEDNNDKGTKISLPNGACDSLRSTSPQPLQEDSSTSPFDSDVSEEGYANEGETSDQSEKLLVISPLTELPDPPTSRPVSSSAPISQTSECHNDRHSGFNQSVVGQKNVASIMPNSVKQNVGKKALFKGQPKKLTEPELEKMRLGLKNWMDEIRREVHTTVAESQPVLAPKTTPFEKPKKSAPKAAAKKKEPDPYFGDYRPPKRVKPRPYVTDKMYKFLEKRLKDKFGLEARIKAEEFVRLMCNLVQNTIKEKNAKKYHPMVFKLRNEMVKLGLIKTQFDYHLFIEDYLPDAFRVKSIPCYGCSKGPTLDVDDLYSDLSIK